MAKTVHHTRQQHVGVLRRIEHLGMSKGRRGSKSWLYVGTGLWTLRTIRRLADRREEILISETLQPGQRLIISNARPTLDEDGTVKSKRKQPRTKRGRKKLAKAEAKAAKKQAKLDAKANAKEAELQAKRAAKMAKKAKRAKPVATSDAG